MNLWTWVSSERLQKVLAAAGLGSRRSCDELVAAGRVRVNGRVASPGSRADIDTDLIEVDGEPVVAASGDVYYLLHKPSGVVTTSKDTHGRRTVLDLVPSSPRVFAVGRLDLHTTGALLLTSDGGFANRVAHPSSKVPKTYVARVVGPVSGSQLKALRSGVDLEDGPARADRVRVVGRHQGRTLLELVLHEGRNRVVRRMVAALGLELDSLHRSAIGPVGVQGLRPGAWRELTLAERSALGRRAE